MFNINHFLYNSYTASGELDGFEATYSMDVHMHSLQVSHMKTSGIPACVREDVKSNNQRLQTNCCSWRLNTRAAASEFGCLPLYLQVRLTNDHSANVFITVPSLHVT